MFWLFAILISFIHISIQVGKAQRMINEFLVTHSVMILKCQLVVTTLQMQVILRPI
jgi:hypothetical protein